MAGSGVLPRTPILHFKTRVAGSWLGIARTEPQNPSDRKMAQDWTCGWLGLLWLGLGVAHLNWQKSGTEKAHKHKQISPVTAQVGGGLPTGWPGVKSLCAMCGTQGISTFSSGCPAGRIGYPGREDRWPGWPRNCLCAKCLCAFSGP